jgi:hypothetical protein
MLERRFQKLCSHPDVVSDPKVNVAWWESLEQVYEREQVAWRLFVGSQPTLEQNKLYARFRAMLLKGSSLKFERDQSAAAALKLWRSRFAASPRPLLILAENLFLFGATSTPSSFAGERLPCGKRVHVISPANNLSILDGDDGHESVVIRSARFDGFAMNLIFQSDHAAFLVTVNRKTITFFKRDVVAVARVGGNQVFSPSNHFRPAGEPI